MIDETSGYCSEDEGTCGTLAAIPFFVSFRTIATLILANLVIAVMVDMFATFSRYDRARVTSTDLTVFVDAWSDFDPDGTGMIVTDDLPRLLLKVPEPLGLKGSTITRANLLSLHLQLHSREDGAALALRDVLVALVDYNYFRSDPELVERAAIPKLDIATMASAPAPAPAPAPAAAPAPAPAPAPRQPPQARTTRGHRESWIRTDKRWDKRDDKQNTAMPRERGQRAASARL